MTQGLTFARTTHKSLFMLQGLHIRLHAQNVFPAGHERAFRHLRPMLSISFFSASLPIDAIGKERNKLILRSRIVNASRNTRPLPEASRQLPPDLELPSMRAWACMAPPGRLRRQDCG